MIFNLAIVEDEDAAAENLQDMIEKFEAENKGDSFRIARFSDALSFLMEDCSAFDAIFLDIHLPDMSGMKAAHRIRQKDENVLIVFVTNMAQYAVESYEVHAYDFLLKPVTYGNFFMKFRRILKELGHRRNDACITLSTRFEKKRIRILDIMYVEVINHDLFFHLNDGEYRITGTMSELEKQLSAHHFVRVNSGYLVNLKYVTALHAIDSDYASSGQVANPLKPDSQKIGDITLMSTGGKYGEMAFDFTLSEDAAVEFILDVCHYKDKASYLNWFTYILDGEEIAVSDLLTIASAGVWNELASTSLFIRNLTAGEHTLVVRANGSKTGCLLGVSLKSEAETA